MFLSIKQKKSCFIGLVFSLATCFSPCLADPPLNALPTGGTSVAGNVQFNQAGNTLNVSSTANRSIANYSSFNVGENSVVNFNLPTANSAILNRISSLGGASEIFGQINSNGQVFLLNSGGIIFGRTAQVNASSFVASTLGIRNQDFLNGDLSFRQVGGQKPSFINNKGSITTDGGSAVFLGGTFENSGTIRANNGNVLVGIGEVISIPVEAGVFVDVEVSQGLNKGAEGFDKAISNTGSGIIQALNGDVKAVVDLRKEIYTTAVNNEGLISASAATFNEDGSVSLTPGQSVSIEATGRRPAGIDSRGLIEAQNINLDSGRGIIIGGSGTGNGTAILGTGGGNINLAAADNIDIRSKIDNTEGNINLASAKSINLGDADADTERALIETHGFGDINLSAGKKIGVADSIIAEIGNISLRNVYLTSNTSRSSTNDSLNIPSGGIYITAPIATGVGDIELINQNVIELLKDVFAVNLSQQVTAKSDIVIRDSVGTGLGNINVETSNSLIAESDYVALRNANIALNLFTDTFVGGLGELRTGNGNINIANFNAVAYNYFNDPTNTISPSIITGRDLNFTGNFSNKQEVFGNVIAENGDVTLGNTNILLFAGPVQTVRDANFTINNLNTNLVQPSGTIEAPLGTVNILPANNNISIDSDQFNVGRNLNINITP